MLKPVLCTPNMPAAQPKLLITDQGSATFLASHFGARGYAISIAHTAEEAVRQVREHTPALVVLDTALPGMPASTAIARIKQESGATKVVVIADVSDASAIFKLSKAGADELVTKPYKLNELDSLISALVQVGPASGARADKTTEISLLYGASSAMAEIRNIIEQVADTTATVLVRGESGTGKEVTARMIYSQSSRRDRPFVKVNCAAIPNELLESELFGYESGAFTGAVRQKLGKFEQASYGTIFLDEISEMHPALQAKLLHVLQDGTFSRLGGKREISVDVRVIAATNKDIEEAVRQGAFREDLFYRLNVITLYIPPLRERTEEIPVLLSYFHQKYSEVYGKNPPPFSDAAVEQMMSYRWPGNIRELENLVKRYVIVGNEAQIVRELSSARPLYVENRAGMLAPKADQPVTRQEDTPSLLEIGRRAANRAEYEAIERVLHQTRWNRRQAAKILKVSYKALLNKLKAMEAARSASD